MNNIDADIYALLGGILPAVAWLCFWLREDNKRPEPKGRLLETFLAGMLAVLLVLPFQKVVSVYVPGLGALAFLLWAIPEEVFKFLAAYFTALKSKDDDEPIDSLIYMITAALGFVALENALFIWNPLSQSDVMLALSTGGLRFLGASLLHVVASSAVGFSMALSYYKPKEKWLYITAGLFLAVALHTFFNLFILRNPGSTGTLETFSFVWLGIALLLLCFEKVKTIARY